LLKFSGWYFFVSILSLSGFGVQKKKKAVANGPPTRSPAAKRAPCSRSNFAEFRRQMKMKNAAAAADDDAVTVPSPGCQSPRSGTKHAVSL